MSPSFFTQAQTQFEVPHDPIGVRWILVAHIAVTTAFTILRVRKFDLCAAKEDEITNQLENVLRNDLLRKDSVPSLNPDFFRDVTRGSEVENYNGQKINKKPDLVFHLQRENRLWDRRQDALFAECKPVGKIAHRLSTNYCAVGSNRSGIERFVIGNYAWAMQEALMIGYVRDGLKIHPDLADALKEKSRKVSLGYPSLLQEIVTATPSGDLNSVFHTLHQRNFPWRNQRPATPITVYHSWHDCS